MAESTAKLIEGADLDVVLQEPLKKSFEMVEKAQESRLKLQAFRKDSTLLVEEIKNFKDHFDQPREKVAKLIQEKEEGDKLVGKSLKMEVLREGPSTLEMTGLSRSGKATLVGKFGSDDQVKGTRMRYFADHQQKMTKKKVVMVPPKRGSIKRQIFLAIFNFMANMISHICCSNDSN